MPDEPNPFDKYRSKLDKEFVFTRAYLQSFEDGWRRAIMDAHESVQYQIIGADNKKKFKDVLVQKLEAVIRAKYPGLDITKINPHEFEGLMQKHFGMTRAHIEDVIGQNEEWSREELERAMEQNHQQYVQQHWQLMANEYLTQDNLGHARNYAAETWKFKQYNIDHEQVTQQDLTRLFLQYGMRGEVPQRFVKSLPKAKPKPA